MRAFAPLLTILMLPLVANGQESSVAELFEMLNSSVEEERRDAQIALELVAEEENPIIYGGLAAHFDLKQPPDLEAAEYFYRRWAETESEDGYVELARFFRRQNRLDEFVGILEVTRERFDSSIATFGLADAYNRGVGVNKDQAHALKLLQELYDRGAIYVPTCFRCDADDIRMIMVLALLDTESDAYNANDALRYAEEMSADGDYAGATLWASHMLAGDHPTFHDRAIRTLHTVRTETTNPSEYAKASFYLSTHLFSLEPSQSFLFAESALSRDDIESEDKEGLYFVVGLHLLTGYGTEANPERALDMFVEASRIGDPDATAIVAVLTAESVNTTTTYGCKYACEIVEELIKKKQQFQQIEASQPAVASRPPAAPSKRAVNKASGAKGYFGQLFEFAVELLTAVAVVAVEIAESNPHAVGYMLSGAPGYYPTQTTSTSRSSTIGTSNAARECTSDFQCPNGYACVKKPYQSRGLCLRSVSEWGNTMYEKRIDSVYPGQPACDFHADCPVGFTCDVKLRQCVR